MKLRSSTTVPHKNTASNTIFEVNPKNKNAKVELNTIEKSQINYFNLEKDYKAPSPV